MVACALLAKHELQDRDRAPALQIRLPGGYAKIPWGEAGLRKNGCGALLLQQIAGVKRSEALPRGAGGLRSWLLTQPEL